MKSCSCPPCPHPPTPWGVSGVTHEKSKTNFKCWGGTLEDVGNKKYWKYFIFGKNVLNDFATQISIKMILQKHNYGLIYFQNNVDAALIQAWATDNQDEFWEVFLCRVLSISRLKLAT